MTTTRQGKDYSMRYCSMWHLIALLWLNLLSAHAQQVPAFTHYWMLPAAYNPAAAGRSELLNVVVAYNSQLTGYERAPRTMLGAVDVQLSTGSLRHGVGAYMLKDALGLFDHTRLSAQYNYQLRLWGGTLAIGGQLDLLNETFKGTKLDVEDASDQALPRTDVNGSKLDASAGLYYTAKGGRWYAALSALHLTAPTVTLGETYHYGIKRTFFAMGGYNIPTRWAFLTLHPSVFGAYDGADYMATATLRADYRHEGRYLFGAASYSVDRSVAIAIGGQWRGIVLTYSYEAYMGGVGLGHGSHEVVVGYQMPLSLGKKQKNRHKSVRLL